MKFTFKRDKRETGIRAVGYPHASVRIKLGGKEVGYLAAPNWQTKDRLWRIRFSVKTLPTPENPACWKWVTLKFKDLTEEACRKFVLDNAEAILKLNLHEID